MSADCSILNWLCHRHSGPPINSTLLDRALSVLDAGLILAEDQFPAPLMH